MVEPKTVQNLQPSQDPNPPTATVAQTTPLPPQPQPPPPQAPSTAPEQPTSKKRALGNNNDQFQNSNYFKIRLVLKDLRPHFIEVLGSPDFRNGKATGEIRENMKLLVDLYKEMASETVSTSRSQPLPGETGMKPKPEEQPQVVKPVVSSENNTVRSSSICEGQSEAAGTYIVGGSAFGWNFITFTGKKPVYYGVTKETFRSAHGTLGRN